MLPAFQRRCFPSPDALARALADEVCASLESAVDERGRAGIALSGGTTPMRFLRELGGRDIRWDAVTVTLADERFVPPSSDRSNERLIRTTLLSDKAGAARFVPLHFAAPDVEAAAAAAALAQMDVGDLDVVVLGMGSDGHTASFFGDARDIDRLLDPSAEQPPVLPVRSARAGEPRLTLSLPRLASARRVFLHIEGEEKKRVLERALSETAAPALPVRRVLESLANGAEIFWSPAAEG